MIAKHQWEFKARFRAEAYGWKGSGLAIKRLKEVVAEIRKVSRTDSTVAAEGAVALFERLWLALQFIDTSSGALGSAVHWTQEKLIPLVIAAPVERKTREQWLERLWVAIDEDGVDYLWVVQDYWGELCGSREVASQWAERFLPLLRTVWGAGQTGRDCAGYERLFVEFGCGGAAWGALGVACDAALSVLGLPEVWGDGTGAGR